MLSNENKTFCSSRISIFELGIFSFNSYVYYLTSGFIASTRAFNLLTRAFNLPTRAFNLATRAFSLLIREFELVTHRFELVTRGFELVTRWFELVTRVFLFHEIRTSIVFNLSFPNNTIVSCFFFFFFIIVLYFLIPSVIAQIFIPTAELVIPTGTQTNEANAEIETPSND